MKHYPAPPLDPTVIESLRRIAESGVTREELIEKMRLAGLSIVPSIRLLSQFAGLSIGEAKEAVHFSRTWADCLQANNAVHQAAFEAARQLGVTEAESSHDSEPAEILQTH